MAKTIKRRRGDVLQPGRFTPAVVRGLRMKSTTFDGQYQQEPAPATGRIFNPTWWRYYKEAPEFEMVVLSVDCTFKSGKENDLVAIQKWGTVGVRSYLIERQTEHMGYIQTKAAIRAMQKHGRPASVILIEDKANGPAIVEELQADHDFGASVIAVDPQGDKVSRANAASTDVEAGSVYLPEGAEWVGTFVRTFAAFPGVKHDDDVDSSSQFINWRRTRNLSYGLLELFTSGRAAEIEARPLPALKTTRRAHVVPAEVVPACPICKSNRLVSRKPVAGGWQCNQCQATCDNEGNLTSQPVNVTIGVDCCDEAKRLFKENGKPYVQKIPEGVKCNGCSRQSGRDPRTPAPMGVSRKQHFAGLGFAIKSPRNRSTYGRFG
jgi:predicted phage terminase large subunit-like protein